MTFTITGTIRETESGSGVSKLHVHAFDRDLMFDDVLGSTQTDEHGHFILDYNWSDFRDLFELCPDIYLEIKSPTGAVLHSTVRCVRWNSSKHEVYDLNIDRLRLGQWAPEPPTGDGPSATGTIRVDPSAVKLLTRANYAFPQLPGFRTTGSPGSPALPQQTRYAIIPAGSQVKGIVVDPGASVQIEAMAAPFPVQPSIPDIGTNPKEFGDRQAEQGAIPFVELNKRAVRRLAPEELARITHVEDVGPFTVAHVQVRPMTWDPESSGYLLHPKLSWRVDFEAPKEPAKRAPVGAAKARQLEIAFKDVGVVFGDWGGVFGPILPPEEVLHLIITDNYRWPESVDDGAGETAPPELSDRGTAVSGDMVSEYERLAEWKTARGVRSRVITISDIVSGKWGDHSQGGFARDLQEVIRNFLRWAHRTWGTLYVLAAGDVGVVPIRKLVGSTTYGTIGCSRTTDNPPPKGRCCVLGDVVKLHPKFTPQPGDPISSYYGTLRIPFEQNAGAGQLGWYYTSEEDFTALDSGFERLPVGQTSKYVIIEGPEAVLDDHYYWVREVNSIPSDLYYSSLIGDGYEQTGKHDFDLNNNGLYGQHWTDSEQNKQISVDNIDMWSDLWIGRAPTDSAAQAAAFVDRVLLYEKLKDDGGDELNTDWLEEVVYAAAFLWVKSQYRQSDATIPPAEGKFTHAAASTETRMRTVLDMTLNAGQPNYRLLAITGGTRLVIPYDTTASSSSLGWYFVANGTATAVSATPTRHVRVRGPEANIDPGKFVWDPVGLEASAYEKERLRGHMDSWFSSFTDVSRHYDDFFDITAPPTFVPLESTTLNADINNGCHFLSLTGHGSSYGCCGVNSSLNFTNTEKPFIAYAMSCTTAKPETNDSLGEKSVLDSDAGGVGYVGYTRYGWGGVGANYEERFWCALKAFGRMGPATGMRDGYDGSRQMWTTYCQILYGDPEMPVWCTVPVSLDVTHPAAVSPGATFTVTVHKLAVAAPGQKVTIMGGWTSSESKPRILETKTSNGSGQVSFTIPSTNLPSSMQVTVTGKGSRPYIGEISINSLVAVELEMTANRQP